MRRAVLIAVVVWLWAVPAQGAVRPGSTQIVAEDGAADFPYQRWVNRAKVPTPPGTITVEENAGGTSTTEGSQRISLEPRFPPWKGLMHELGHNFDYYVLDDTGRSRFQAILGDSRPWNEHGSGTVRELFADAYQICARWRQWRVHRDETLYSEAAGFVGFTRQREICRVIWAY